MFEKMIINLELSKKGIWRARKRGIEKNSLYLGDCKDYLRLMPDKSIDLAIVDPPYGIGIGKRKTIGKRGKTFSTTKYFQSNWDNEIPDQEYFEELFRVSKNQIIFGGNYFSHFLPPSAGWFVYDKRQPEEFSMAHAELAFTSFDRAIRMKGVKRTEMQNCVSNNKAVAKANAKIHQCQKPVSIYRYLLQQYAKPGDIILDTHGGSASLVEACIAEGFDFIAIEKEKIHYINSFKRIQRVLNKPTLF